MPPRHGGAPPGPSSGPQAASPVDHLFPVLLDAAVKLKPSIANLDPDALRRAFRNAWLARPPPPNDLHTASALLVSVTNRLTRAARHTEDPFESAASFFLFFFIERVYSRLQTYSIHYKSASRRDALTGLVDDYLINSTQRYEKANMGLRQQFTLPHLSEWIPSSFRGFRVDSEHIPSISNKVKCSEWIPSPFRAHSEFMQSHEGV